MGRDRHGLVAAGTRKRIGRIAAGLASPSSRSHYVAAARRRLGAIIDPSAAPERCLACGAGRPRHRNITYAKDGTVFEVRICRVCGHVGNPDNVHDYRNFKQLDKLPMRARVGTADRKGREFHMARMATEIMGRSDLDVLVYGAGRSFDNRHIGALPGVRDVAVADVMKLRDDAEFIDINKPASKQFPLVIACEVVEHFLNPAVEFPALFAHVAKGGLLVCSTNVYDGSDMGKHKYIFTPGHTSYYTPEALIHLARSNGYHLDFRAPLVATGYGGPRKRYLFFSKDASQLTNVSAYFGRHLFAPSERPWANKELAELQKQAEQSDVQAEPPAASA